MLFAVNKVDQHGVVFDVPPHELPFNVWSTARNMRFHDGKAEKFLGETPVFGTPGTSPYWLMNVPYGTSLYWLYAGLSRVFVFDGSTHTDISQAGGYHATADAVWTGMDFGDLPILNNPLDPPQLWYPINTSQPLQDLPAWPANTTCNVLRSFRTYLIALNVTKSGTQYPHMVKWSASAAAGNVPSTWDPSDPTNDAGEYNLMEQTDDVVDGLSLRDLFIIYKENSVWAMQYVGGGPVFNFFKLFNQVGILAPRCAVEFQDGRHAVFSINDIIVHDGVNIQSIVNERDRKYIFSNIDATYGQRSFVSHNKNNFEVWFCWPQIGQTFPSQALVWNYKQNTIGFRDLAQTAYIEEGIVNVTGSSDAWNQAVGNWTVETVAWGAKQFNPNVRQVLSAQPLTQTILELDTTTQFNGVNIPSTLERTGLGFPFREGEPPDFTSRKRFKGLWPRIHGTVGQVVNVYIGLQDEIEQSPTWKGPYAYTIGSSKRVGEIVDTVLLGFRFVHNDSGVWSLSGYEVEITQSGRY